MRNPFRRKQFAALEGAAVMVTPGTIVGPGTDEQVQIDVSGFEEGNFVSVGVPWVGTPARHSNLSYSQYIDASGGFSIIVPPDWTDFNLAPGLYEVISRYAVDGASDTQPGPVGLFEVVAP